MADARGWELATLLRVRRHTFIDGFHVSFHRNEFRALRLRFMLNAVEHGHPTRLLLTDDIQLTVSEQRTGWLSLDLRRYNLHLAKGQIVAAGIQWLDGTKERPGRCTPVCRLAPAAHQYLCPMALHLSGRHVSLLLLDSTPGQGGYRFLHSPDRGHTWREEWLPAACLALPLAFFGAEHAWLATDSGQLLLRQPGR